MALLSQATIDGTQLAGLNPESSKKVLLACNRCGTKYQVAYKSYLAKQREYRRNGETYCRGCSNIVSKGKRRLGPPKTSRATGKRNANFKGGRFVASDGQMMTLVAPGQYRREDFLVLEREIGRSVRADERVLHIDFDKTNNARENLVLLPDETTYRTAKRSLQVLALKLLRFGFLEYDGARNSYEPAAQLCILLGIKERA